MKLPLLRKAHHIDEVYNAVIAGLLSENDRSAPRKQKVDTNEVYIREQVAADPALVLRHLKDYENSKKRKRKCSIAEQFDDSDIEEIKPQNGLFLRHLKEEERVYTQNSHCVAENLCANERKYLVKNESCCQSGAGISEVNKVDCARKVRKDGINVDKSYVAEESDGRSKRVKKCKLEKDGGKKAIDEDGAAKRKTVGPNQLQEKCGPEHAAKDQPVEKFKGVVKQEVKEEIYQNLGNKTDQCVEIRCFNSAEIFKEEVEILDSDMVVNERILTPFVPEEMHHTLTDDESQHHALFRKEVLKAMTKPYDKEEHQNHRETMKDGSYLNHYPGLRRLLAKFRYHKVKRLIIIRGFLFYLQNAAREGAFHPWEDEECLDILNQEK